MADNKPICTPAFLTIAIKAISLCLHLKSSCVTKGVQVYHTRHYRAEHKILVVFFYRLRETKIDTC